MNALTNVCFNALTVCVAVRVRVQALRQFSDALSFLRNAVAQSPTVRGLCLLAETQVAIGEAACHPATLPP